MITLKMMAIKNQVFITISYKSQSATDFAPVRMKTILKQHQRRAYEKVNPSKSLIVRSIFKEGCRILRCQSCSLSLFKFLAAHVSLVVLADGLHAEAGECEVVENSEEVANAGANGGCRGFFRDEKNVDIKLRIKFNQSLKESDRPEIVWVNYLSIQKKNTIFQLVGPTCTYVEKTDFRPCARGH